MTPPMKKKKRTRSKLGRGLSALVDQSGGVIEVAPELNTDQIANIVRDAATQSNQASAQIHNDGLQKDGSVVIEIDVTRVVPNAHQPRRAFAEAPLEELARSIAEHGLLQPIVVRVDRSGDEERYELIAGERRWRASCRTGKRLIRAIVLDVDDSSSAQLALIENIQREDLNAIEQACGFAALASGFSMTQEQIASKVGINRSSVANLLRLLELDEQIQSMIRTGGLGRGHGKVLLSCKDLEQRLQLAQRAQSEEWTVRLLEKAVSAIEHDIKMGNLPHKMNSEGAGEDERTRVESILWDLEKRIGEHLGTSVRLKTDHSGTKGSLSIAFYDLDHFEGLLRRLGIDGAEELGE